MATNEQGSGMATNEQTHEGRGLLDLAVCYLVFHVFGSAVVLALLTSSTLAYVGASEVSAELAPTVTVLGAELPVRVLLIVFGWPPRPLRWRAWRLVSRRCSRACGRNGSEEPSSWAA